MVVVAVVLGSGEQPAKGKVSMGGPWGRGFSVVTPVVWCLRRRGKKGAKARRIRKRRRRRREESLMFFFEGLWRERVWGSNKNETKRNKTKQNTTSCGCGKKQNKTTTKRKFFPLPKIKFTIF